MHLLICIYAHVYTHINTQHILSCPPGQFRSWDTNTFKRKSMAKQKTNNNNKKQSPIEKNRSKKRFTERTSRETQETPHCPREYTFSEQLKRLQRSIQRSTIYQFFHNCCLCRTFLEHSSALHDKPASLCNNVPLTKQSLHNTISSDTTDVRFGIKGSSCCLECSPFNEAL